MYKIYVIWYAKAITKKYNVVLKSNSKRKKNHVFMCRLKLCHCYFLLFTMLKLCKQEINLTTLKKGMAEITL